MENIYISPGNCTPEVIFEQVNAKLYIGGRSYPSDPAGLYMALLNQIKSYLESGQIRTNFEVIFKLEYFNTSTSKEFAKLFKILEESLKCREISIKWYYYENDIDMMEAGKRFSAFTFLPFEIIRHENNTKFNYYN